MHDDLYCPRISFDVSEETLNRARKIIPWGMRTQLLNRVMEDLLNVLEVDVRVAGLLMQGKLKFVPVEDKGEDDG